MKKLFFAALLATVAVGGAFAQAGSFYSPGSDEIDRVCEGGTPLCSIKYDNETLVYTNPFNDPNGPGQTEDTERNLTSFTYTPL